MRISHRAEELCPETTSAPVWQNAARTNADADLSRAEVSRGKNRADAWCWRLLKKLKWS